MSKLFKNEQGFTRITKEYRPVLIQRVLSYLEKELTFGEKNLVDRFYTKIEASYELDFKKDYGDLDLIVLCKKYIDLSSALIDYESTHTDSKITKVSVNGNTISFFFIDSNEGEELRGYHVDMVRCSDQQNYQNMVDYFRNGIVNNFLGQFLKSFGIRAGHNGIFYSYVDRRGNSIRIKLMDEFAKFYMDYFNVDVTNLRFFSFEELMQYLLDSPCFPGVEIYKTTNSSDKKRALKLHGLTNEIYKRIEATTEAKYQNTGLQVPLKPEHQAIVDVFIKNHELRLDVNTENRTELFTFLKKNGVTDGQYYKQVFPVLMPILNQVKLEQGGYIFPDNHIKP